MILKKFKWLLLVLPILCLCSCNMGCSFGNFTFNKVHCTITDECYTINTWYNNEMGIEVNTKEYGSLYFSEGTYILVEDKCPLCSKN